MYGVFLAIHVVISVLLIGFILIQHGKGAQAGAAFGSGASQTVFGSQGSGNFLSRMTTYLATGFFVLNLVLAYIVNQSIHRQSMIEMPSTPVTAPLQSDTQTGKPAPSDADVPSVD